MGCGSSKSEETSIRYIRLQPVGVLAFDKFNDSIERVIEDFATIEDSVKRRRKAFDSLTGFTGIIDHAVENGGLKKSTMGMLLQFTSVANGDPSKVKVDVIERKPFIKISLHGLTIDNADKQIEAFEAYVDEIFDCFEVKMPKILELMNSLVERAPEVQQ